MPSTREQLLEASKKAKLSPRQGKRGKSWQTIAKENARKQYEDKLAQHFDQISSVQFQEAKKPKNMKERVYVVDQFIGKPMERVKLEAELEVVNDF